VSKDRETTAGVSYKDVEVAMRELMRDYNCNVTFDFCTPVSSGTSVVFWVRIAAEPRWVGKKTVRAVIACQRRWPHVDHKTMAGLMLYLCFELGKSLESSGQVPVQEALFD